MQSKRIPEAFYRVRSLEWLWGVLPLCVARGEALWQNMVLVCFKGLKGVLKTRNSQLHTISCIILQKSYKTL